MEFKGFLLRIIAKNKGDFSGVKCPVVRMMKVLQDLREG